MYPRYGCNNRTSKGACVCVRMRVCVRVCAVHICAGALTHMCAQRPEVDSSCHSLLLHLVAKTESLTDPGVH